MNKRSHRLPRVVASTLLVSPTSSGAGSAIRATDDATNRLTVGKPAMPAPSDSLAVAARIHTAIQSEFGVWTGSTARQFESAYGAEGCALLDDQYNPESAIMQRQMTRVCDGP
jgi:hypothetical protein